MARWESTIRLADVRTNKMLHYIAQEFSTLGNGVLDVGRAVVDLVQDIIDIATPNNRGGGAGGGQYPFN
jgi:hypothetical protein